MAEKKSNKNHKQQQATVRIVTMIAILICVNVLASYFHKGLDLTHEERFTLSAPTKTMLRNMKETAVVEVYLKGKFPADLQRLQEAVRERLTSFKEIAGNKFIFRFIDPFEGKDEKEQKQVARDLAQKGIRVLQLNTQSDDEYSTKFFFPYALVQYNGNEMPVLLLEDLPKKSAAEKISYAEGKLEYKFAFAINEMSKPDAAHIAYIVGNDQDLGMNTMDMLYTISHYYHVDTLNLKEVQTIPRLYDAIIVNKPKEAFTVAEKVRLDQYIMHGGHVLWIINALSATEDSLLKSSQFLAMSYDLQLDDMLFKYGVRINNDLVEDVQCMQLPRMYNGQADIHDWIYYPRINPTSEHPIVRNMGFVAGRFSNSIDTLKSDGIKKTILLQSSKYSRTALAPARVSLSMMNYPVKKEMFNNPYRTMAILLEGKFYSAYDKRLAPESLHFLDSMHIPFKPACDSANSMIVLSVGDVFGNGYSVKEGVLPLGYYQWTGEFFANRNLLINCLEYLTDKSGVLEARSKEVKLRLLDVGRAKDEKTMWQAVNVGIPVAAVLVFASAYFFFRRRRYESKSNPVQKNA